MTHQVTIKTPRGNIITFHVDNSGLLYANSGNKLVDAGVIIGNKGVIANGILIDLPYADEQRLIAFLNNAKKSLFGSGNAGTAEKERRYDDLMNEAAEGYNPHRDQEPGEDFSDESDSIGVRSANSARYQAYSANNAANDDIRETYANTWLIFDHEAGEDVIADGDYNILAFDDERAARAEASRMSDDE